MKKLLLALVCWVCSLLYGNAQSISNVSHIRMAFSNVVNKEFFLENPKVRTVIIEYKQGRSASLAIYYQPNDNFDGVPDEFYDLTFAGDRYLLAKRYRPIDFLFYPKTGLINETISIKPIEHQYRIRELVDIDSIRYQFIVNQVSEDEVAIFEPGPVTATYIGGSERLTFDVNNHCAAIKKNKKEKSFVEGFILLFRGEVGRDGSLNVVELVVGEPLDISIDIKRCIEATSGSWRPALQGGRPVKSWVDIFVEIDCNQEMVISFSGLNRR